MTGVLSHNYSSRVYLGAAPIVAPLVSLTLDRPEILYLSEGETGRDAILLECCDLPDKGLTLSESDLDGIASRFVPGVPIRVEHIPSALDPLGAVERVWRVGRQLMGRIGFPPDMASFLRSRGAVKLSCGLERSPLSLAEVSLVLKPRLQAAVLLSEDDAGELVRLRADNEAQRVLLTTQKVDAQILAYKRQGKIVPATEPLARVLLSAPPSALITLSDGTTQDVAKTFADYLAAQMAVVTLAEAAASVAPPAEGVADEFTPDEADFLTNRLGVDPAKVAETLRKEEAARAA